jgi:hypothetical protein
MILGISFHDLKVVQCSIQTSVNVHSSCWKGTGLARVENGETSKRISFRGWLLRHKKGNYALQLGMELSRFSVRGYIHMKHSWSPTTMLRNCQISDGCSLENSPFHSIDKRLGQVSYGLPEPARISLVYIRQVVMRHGGMERMSTEERSGVEHTLCA